jgi:Rrf2 family protein
MRISATEEYGLRCLIDLARKGPNGQLSIHEVSEIEKISVPYASKLLSILRRAGLVSAVRGRTGGFSLARPASEITMYDILTSLGGPFIDPNHCHKYPGHAESCVHIGNCQILNVLGGLAGFLQEVLNKTSLEDMAHLNYPEILKRRFPAETQGASISGIQVEIHRKHVSEISDSSDKPTTD